MLSDMLAGRLRGERYRAQLAELLGVDDAWLLLEWLPPGDPGEETWPRLGRELAALHTVRADAFGEVADNFIGPLPQSNAQGADWPAFWRDRRLAPQLERRPIAG